MALVIMNVLLLLFSVVLVRSDQTTTPLKSFKISGNVTYDCINIYKQPGLDHPLLKNHTIQMKPSRTELNSQTGNSITQKNKIKCPDGTIPVLRNTKDFLTSANLFPENYVHPQSVDSPGTHIAGVRSHAGPYRGIQAWVYGVDLKIEKDQASYSQIYLGSGVNNKINYISAGFMINPGYFGDGRVWSYGFWKGKDGKGCYNTACSGFVQVSQTIPIVQPIDISPTEPSFLRPFIHQDKNTGNWWLTYLGPDKPNGDLGYWPKELFDHFDNGANMVGVGGVVKASPSGSSPPMGNGKFPDGGRRTSAIFANIDVLNSNYEQSKISSFPIEILVDSPQCYGLRVGTVKWYRRTRLGYFFNYGGPGGNSCGV
ncbi:hypothetical protein IGI04_008430 [Brassica rapa subsp. trilocularis]|uniref:Neprosin PEP catalytic domain-containing protein n=3 Tax=Brassica TaxID=3705 RepID=A0A3P6AG31_BRACM|nr:hypothetical protein IGI04_008430 [Brassica rapa subsp. trilocularis]CAF2144641.1 unnamed protein product [Brassica napus]CAG7895881.1 unnamed protein product [Brassica rapa]VDC92716.1 unnamed protein product [Brassica rapa]